MRNSISTSAYNLVLVWACVAHGLRVQSANTQMESMPDANSGTVAEVNLSSRPESDTGWLRPRFQALASLLVQLNPASAYSLTTPGVHSTRRPLLMGRSLPPLMRLGEADESPAADNAATQEAAHRGFSRRQILTGGLAAAALLSQVPRSAEASFGSARGAVTSPPKAQTDFGNLDIFEALDPRKQAQVQSLLKPLEIEQLRSGIKLQRDKLQTQIEFAITSNEQRTAKLKELRERWDMLTKQVSKIDADLDMAQLVANKVQSKVGEDKASTSKELQEELDKAKFVVKALQQEKETLVREQKETEELLQEQLRLTEAATSEEEEEVSKAKADLQRKLELDARIAKRESLLQALDAQPEWFNYAAAFLASITSTLVMHPIDTLKTREVVGVAADDTDKEEDDNPLAGYLSLYQGISGNLLKEGPPSAAYLGVYEFVKAKLLADPTFAPYPLLVYLLGGAAGETVGSVIRAPAEAIKSRVQSGIDASTGESIQRCLLEEEGRANIVRSWTASLWRDVPFGGIQLAIFEGIKSFIINSPQSFLDVDVNTLLSEVVFGVIGGGIGAFLTTPMDVVTTRIMMQGRDGELVGFLGMSSRVFNRGGWKELFTGWKARTGYWAPAVGIFLASYCGIRQAAIDQNLFS